MHLCDAAMNLVPYGFYAALEANKTKAGIYIQMVHQYGSYSKIL